MAHREQPAIRRAEQSAEYFDNLEDFLAEWGPASEQSWQKSKRTEEDWMVRSAVGSAILAAAAVAVITIAYGGEHHSFQNNFSAEIPASPTAGNGG